MSKPRKMALLTEAARIAAEFELTDEQVQKTVTEFIAEMSALCHHIQPKQEAELTMAQMRAW